MSSNTGCRKCGQRILPTTPVPANNPQVGLQRGQVPVTPRPQITNLWRQAVLPQANTLSEKDK